MLGKVKKMWKKRIILRNKIEQTGTEIEKKFKEK